MAAVVAAIKVSLVVNVQSGIRCGAFGGDAVLKFLIQWMAAAEAGRRLDYFTFKDAQLSARIQLLHRELLAANTTVGQLMHLLGEFKPGQYVKGPIGGGEQLQNFVLHRVSRQH
ncbi:hypothetical protein T484DRAFT_2864747 [Baffinella frigidus]|nr:hypothetical protein T484DRAFT_2864747 [Cryptophyta sp. CCMP2293]